MRLFQTLKPKPKGISDSTCLLLDVSGSMGSRLELEEGDGLDPRRIDQMFKVIRATPECQGLKAWTFSAECMPLEVIPEAEDHFPTKSSTNLANAFLTVKAAGYYSAILVTDGEPDSESEALNAAAGMKLGIIYIGNPPVPLFLEKLAKATDGTFAIADMRSTDQLKIALQAALPAPEDVKPEGAIKL